MTAATLATFILVIVFVGALANTLVQHAFYAIGRRPREFFAFLETSGWLTLALACGIALFRLGPGLLWGSAAAIGVLFALVGAIFRAPDRA